MWRKSRYIFRGWAVPWYTVAVRDSRSCLGLSSLQYLALCKINPWPKGCMILRFLLWHPWLHRKSVRTNTNQHSWGQLTSLIFISRTATNGLPYLHQIQLLHSVVPGLIEMANQLPINTHCGPHQRVLDAKICLFMPLKYQLYMWQSLKDSTLPHQPFAQVAFILIIAAIDILNIEWSSLAYSQTALLCD